MNKPFSNLFEATQLRIMLSNEIKVQEINQKELVDNISILQIFKKILVFFLFFLLNVIVFAQADIQWQKCFGGSDSDEAYSIVQSIDGDYVIAGYTRSNDGDVSGYNGGLYDAWVIKTNTLGDIVWKKCLGGSGSDVAYCIELTADGGYILACSTESSDGDVTDFKGGVDAWIVKLNSEGEIEWQKCYGGSQMEKAFQIKRTSDEGYVFVGSTFSNNGDVSLNHGSEDIWVVKLDGFGNIEWEKSLGGSDGEQASSIMETIDYGYIVAGSTGSNNGDVSGYHGNTDAWVVKLSNTGVVEWQKCLGGSEGEAFSSIQIQQTNDAGYILLSHTSSNNGDVSGHHNVYSNDAWLVKLSSVGVIEWQKCLGGTNGDTGKNIFQDSNGGYIVICETRSYNGDVSGNHGNTDAWVARLDRFGAIEWQKCIGGSLGDYPFGILPTIDDALIMVGSTESNDGDVYENNGLKDSWVVKIINHNISGFVFRDENQNEVYDGTDQAVSGKLIKLEPGPQYSFTNNEGRFYFNATDLNVSVSMLAPNNWYSTTDSIRQVTLEQSTVIIDTLKFGIDMIVNTPDIASYITGTTTRAGFGTHYFLNYRNLGTVTTSGTLYFEYDPLLTFISSTINPDSHIGNLISWNYDVLGTGVQNSIRLDFLVPGIENFGDTLISKSWITPLTPDSCVANNFDSINQEITGSYDPNAKTVNPIGYFEEGYVLHGQKLNYTICFQNTGNDTAFTIILRDTLDLTKMDIETFFVEANSHPVEWQLKNSNVMEFTFNNIRLPDSIVNEPESHGFIRFSISPKSGLTDYSVVNNTAYIYFDYNPPIVTNTTKNTYVSTIPGLVQVLSSSELITSFYPNPVKDELNFSFTEDGLKIIRITNIIGQTVFQTSTDKNQLEINFSMFDKGLYFICIMCNNKESFAKIIKE